MVVPTGMVVLLSGLLRNAANLFSHTRYVILIHVYTKPICTLSNHQNIHT